MLPNKRKKCSNSAQNSIKRSRVLEMLNSAPKSAEMVPSAIRTCLVSPGTALLYPAFKNNNQKLGGLGRVCATGMNRSIGLVEFLKLQAGIFVEWKAPKSHNYVNYCRH